MIVEHQSHITNPFLHKYIGAEGTMQDKLTVNWLCGSGVVIIIIPNLFGYTSYMCKIQSFTYLRIS